MNKNGCQELANIKYQTMLLNNNNNKTTPTFVDKSNNTIKNMDSFLETEKETTKKNPWSKLSTTTKLKKIKAFVDDYSNKKKNNKIDKQLLFNFLKTALERKKLQRVKDVEYDINTGKIKSVTGLTYLKQKNKFTIKNRNGKINSLKNLAPRKTNKVKNKQTKTKAKTKQKAPKSPSPTKLKK